MQFLNNVLSILCNFIYFVHIHLLLSMPPSLPISLPTQPHVLYLSLSKQTWSQVCLGQLLLSIRHILECG